MGKFRVRLTDKAKSHILQHYQAGDKSTIKKISKILLELSEHPFTGVGQPEKLRYELTGYYSRRINQKDRLIYIVLEEEAIVDVITAKGHYNDK